MKCKHSGHASAKTCSSDWNRVLIKPPTTKPPRTEINAYDQAVRIRRIKSKGSCNNNKSFVFAYVFESYKWQPNTQTLLLNWPTVKLCFRWRNRWVLVYAAGSWIERLFSGGSLTRSLCLIPRSFLMLYWGSKTKKKHAVYVPFADKKRAVPSKKWRANMFSL